MGLFANILNAFTNAASLAYEISKDQHLTGAQQEANEFSASQAALNRNFQAAEAEKARDWQEKQYLQFNSPQAQMRQYQAAGINPALMFGDPATPASTQTSAPAGDSASSVTPTGGDLVGMIGQMMALKKLGSEIRNIDADTQNKEESTTATALQNELTRKYGAAEAENKVNYLAQQINELVTKQNLETAEAALSFANKTLVENEAKGVQFENTEKEWKAGFIEKFHMTPELAGDLAKALATLGAGILMSFLKSPAKLIESVTSGPKGTTITTNTYQ